MAKRKPHGSDWSIRARNFDGVNHINFETSNGPVMDEIFIDRWFHLEQLTECDWYLYLGGVRLDIHLDKDGKASVRLNGNDELEPESGGVAPTRGLAPGVAILRRIKRLQAATEKAEAQLADAVKSKRPLTETQKAFGQWLIDKLSLYREDSEEGPCPDL